MTKPILTTKDDSLFKRCIKDNFEAMKGFIRILGYVATYKGYAFLNLLFNVLTIVFSVVSLAMVIPFLRLLFGRDIPATPKPEIVSVGTVPDWFYYVFGEIIHQYGRQDALLFICLVVVCIFFFKNLFRYLSTWAITFIRNGVVRDLRNRLFEKTLRMPVSFFTEQRKGDLLSRMSADIQEIETGIMSTLEVTFREPLTMIAYLAAMVILSPQLTLFVFLMLLLTGGIIGRIGKRLKRQSGEAQARLADMLGILEETISGARIIKAFNGQIRQKNRFESVNEDNFDLNNRVMRKRYLSSPLTEFLGIAIVAVVLWFGGRLVLLEDSSLDAEGFIGFMVIFSQLIPPAKSFSTAFYNIQKGLASSDRVHQILDAEETMKEIPEATGITSFEKEIEFREVCFSYEKAQVLKNVNLTIPKGKVVALVGRSGAGKSTLADLVPRFHDPDSGQILLDGLDIRQAKTRDLRALMGIVTQQAFLFNDTIFNNIAFGMEGVSKEEVMQAAKIANAHDFILQTEKGYDTVVGDGGIKLSGGERQRITIARAVLKNPPILILDEATSSLDSESERLVQNAIQNLMQGRTSIVIAHRLSTIQKADLIVVMEDGRLAEQGIHEDLIKKEGIYKRLIELQGF